MYKFKLRASAWRAVLVAVVTLAASPLTAGAQGIEPPGKNYVTDENGVDLISGAFRFTRSAGKIGTLARTATPLTLSTEHYRDSFVGTIHIQDPTWDPATYTISFGGISDTFTELTTNTWGSLTGETASTLVKSGSIYTYYAENGDTIIFDTAYGSVVPVIGNHARVTSVKKANGEYIRIYYKKVGDWVRIQSVTSSYGYQLKYNYVSNTTTTSDWYKIATVVGINNAIEYCDPTADTCTAVFCDPSLGSCANSTSWPAIAYTRNSTNGDLYLWDELGGKFTQNNTVVSPAGVTTVYTTTGMGSGRPGSRVTSINKGGAIWTYDRTLTAIQSEETPLPLASKMIVTDPLNNVTDARGNFTESILNRITDPLLRMTEFTYAGSRKPWETELPEGNIQRVNYAGDMVYNSRIIAKPSTGLADIYTSSVISDVCSGPILCNAYTSITDPKNNTTNYTYHSTYGVLLTKTEPADASGVRPQTRNSYTLMSAQVKNALGLPVSSDPIYMLTQTSTCRSATTVNPASCVGTAQETVTTYAYEPLNLRLASVTVAAGDGSLSATTSYTYDKYGNRITEDGPLAGTVDTTYTTYDIAGRKIFEIGVDPDGASVGSPCTSGCLSRKIVKHSYNADSQETLLEIGTGNSTTGSDFQSLQQTDTIYDSRGRVAIIKARAGSTIYSLTQTNYYADDKLKCTAVRMNPTVYSSITVATDACTPLTESTTYGPDRITQNIYDAAGQLTEVKQAIGTPIIRSYARFTYSSNGLKTTEKDANGNLTKLTYDGLDRLKVIQYPNTTVGSGVHSSSDYEQYNYDANGNRISVRRRDANIITYTYDNLNREIGRDIPGGTDKDVYQTYDLTGNPLAKRFGSFSSSSPGVTYAYDGLGRVSSTTDMNGKTVSYQYNAAGGRTRMTYPDGNWIGSAMDNANRLTTMGLNTTTGIYAQGYNSLGHTISQTKGGGSVTYGVDNLGRLTSMTNDLLNTANDITWTFAYNPAGQQISNTASSTVYDYEELSSITEVSQTHDGLNRIQTLVGATAQCPLGGYDTRQNLICDGARVFTYDIENRLLSAAPALTPTAPFLTLSYDPEGRLASYTTIGTQTKVTEFVYDGVDLIAEYNHVTATPAHSADTLLRRYVHGSGTDDPVIWYEGSVTTNPRYFFQNYQGSVITTADSSGNRGEIYAYGAYGETKDALGNFYWPTMGGTATSRFGYTGQMFLSEASLYHYKARVYDPILGRFLQTDPIGSTDDLNLYGYVAGDPINATDPTGLMYYTDDGFCEQGCDGFLSKVGEVLRDTLTPYKLPDSGLEHAKGNHELGEWAEGAEVRQWAGRETLKASSEAVGIVTPMGAANGGSKVVKGISTVCCFVAGTLVSTDTGLRPIEALKVGDLVLSKDEITGQTAFKPITATIPKHDRVIFEIRFAVELPDRSIRIARFETTNDHPWRTTDGDWLETAQLAAGISIQTAYGSSAKVLSVADTGRIRSTYNIEVADFHTYFVGEDRVWVHNECPIITLTKGFYEARGSAFKFSQRYYEKLWANGRGAPFLTAKEVFNSATSIARDPQGRKGFYKYVNESWEMIYNPRTKEVWHLQPLKK